MSTLSDRLRDATRDIVTGERLLPGLFGHSPIEDLEAAADELDRLTARVAELEKLVAAVASAPFPLHDYVTKEQWEEACHIYAALESKHE